MSDNIKIVCFILLLPFFAAIGHDFYANYMADEQKKARLEALDIDPKTYQVSDLGYVFITYTPALFETVRDSVQPANWERLVDPVLRTYTFLVALVPAALFFLWLFISRIFDIWPFQPSMPRGKGRDAYEQQKARKSAGAFKYKRR